MFRNKLVTLLWFGAGSLIYLRIKYYVKYTKIDWRLLESPQIYIYFTNRVMNFIKKYNNGNYFFIRVEKMVVKYDILVKSINLSLYF